MGRGYSDDLRIRVVRAVEKGMSCRAAARLFEIGESSAIRWVRTWRETGRVRPERSGKVRRSPLEAQKDWLLGLIDDEPDLTLEEIRRKLEAERGQKAGIGSIWRFFDRHGISFKKKRSRRRTRPPRCGKGP